MDRLVKLKSCESDNIVALRSIYDQIKKQAEICITASELENAENFVVKKVQSEQFEKELSFLSHATSSDSQRPPLLISSVLALYSFTLLYLS